MRVRVGGILTAVAIAWLATATPAFASWAGTDPAANFQMPYIPQLCWDPPTGDPTGAACLDWSVGVLDQARASLGLPAYTVPADFDSLSPAQQLFILTNSDRALYGLPPIPGLTDALNQNAAAGVQANADPWPTGSSWMAYTSNWAGGYVNVVQAYEGWMYDDGPGSGNQDCTSSNPSGCWGHRHDVLWQFDGAGATAMGAAAGSYAAGTPSYAMLLVQGSDSAYQPTYDYTWTQALADGANGGVSGGDTGSSTGSGTGSSSSGTGSQGSGSGTSGSGTSGSSDSGSGSTGSSGAGTSSGGSDTGTSGSASGSSSAGSGSGSSTGSESGSSSGSGSSTGSASGTQRSGSGREPSAHVAQVSVAVARVRVRGHRVRLHLEATPGLRITCSLRHWNGRRWRTERSKSCSAWTMFRYVPAGHYRLRVRSGTGTVIRRVVVR